MAPSSEHAVLLMAYGGPDSLADVAPFLADIRGGRATSKALVAEVTERYRAIGGASPLLAITRAQAAALERRLNRDTGSAADGGRCRVFVGMRHWRPRIHAAVERVAAGGYGRLTALCLAPQTSRMSVGAYFRGLDEALAAVYGGAGRPQVRRVASWHDEALFLEAVAEKVVAGLDDFAETADVALVFTAHSLPESILAEGDPYDHQVRETAAGVAQRVEEALARTGRRRPDWRVAYQSAGARAVPWLGPSLDEVLADLAAEGREHVLVAPVGFVSDHVEILYDLDLEAKGRARELGMRLERTASMNTDPRFIAALAAVVERAG